MFPSPSCSTVECLGLLRSRDPSPWPARGPGEACQHAVQPKGQLTCPGCLVCHAFFCLLTFPPPCRLFAYGVGIHLISGQPQRRSTDINPEDDHLSFQVSSCHSRLHHLYLPCLLLGSTPLPNLQCVVVLEYQHYWHELSYSVLGSAALTDCDVVIQADSLKEVQERLVQLGIPFRRQEVVEGGITIQQVSVSLHRCKLAPLHYQGTIWAQMLHTSCDFSSCATGGCW